MSTRAHNASVGSRAFHVVGAPAPADTGPQVVFCSHCGKKPEVVPEVGSRVCQSCGLGLLLEASEALAPKGREAWLVVDKTLAVQALSRRAEKLLGMREVDAVDRHVTDVIVPADAEAQGPHHLSAMLVGAAGGATAMEEAVVRPADEFGVRFAARIGPCGPAQGALIVLDLG